MMSAIDCFKHECIGMVQCPSSYWLRYWAEVNNRDIKPDEVYEIPLYLLQEDALDEDDFEEKNGDLLLGGGSGETPALWIAMPEALLLFTREDWEDFFPEWWIDYGTVGKFHDSLYRHHWGTHHTFMFGEVYVKLGWNPAKQEIELWLV